MSDPDPDTLVVKAVGFTPQLYPPGVKMERGDLSDR